MEEVGEVLINCQHFVSWGKFQSCLLVASNVFRKCTYLMGPKKLKLLPFFFCKICQHDFSFDNKLVISGHLFLTSR